MYSSEVATTVPLMEITPYEHAQSQDANKLKVLPQLPSHKYQHTVWHELRSTQVKGDQLRAPRVREGPEHRQQTFHTATDDKGELIHHQRKGKELTVYRNNQENWENALHVNLSSQLLNDKYQQTNFMRILKRLKSAEKIVLMDDALQDLSDTSFPRCKILNLTKNYFTSFKQLPKAPHLKHLILTYNQIGNLSGLSRYPELEVLELSGNGIYYTRAYRYSVFKVLPKLKVLDGTLKLPSDLEEPTYESQSDEPSSCSLL